MTHPTHPAGISFSLDRDSAASAVRARALSEAISVPWRYCWHGTTKVDSRRNKGGTNEMLVWLPPEATVIHITESQFGWSRAIARLDDAMIEVDSGRNSIDIFVGATSPEGRSERWAEHSREAPSTSPTGPSHHPREHLGQAGDGLSIANTTLTVPTWTEVEHNYPKATGSHLVLPDRQHRPKPSGYGSRLILFHGPPGVGKTYAIRALMSEWREWCRPSLVVDPEAALHDCEYLGSLMERGRVDLEWDVVICEDADRFVRTHNRSSDNGILDRLLNVTDGLIGQCSRTLFLLTTNVEMARINILLCHVLVDASPWCHSSRSAPPRQGGGWARKRLRLVPR